LKSLHSLKPFGLLTLRIVLGLIFFTHGYPKLTHANPSMQAIFVQHGLPASFIYLAGVLETFGGLLFMLGLFARGAALLLACEMAIAIVKVHSVHGIMALHEYEFPLALAAACLALGTIGAGSLSLDYFLFDEASGKGSRAARPGRR
jgi:putative oxidoreductase